MSDTDEVSAVATTRASGSSFYAAMRILPARQRDAMYEIYSFCRQVDDIADSDAPSEERLERLQGWRVDIDAIYASNPPRHLAGLAATARTFGLARDDFLAVIDGMQMDAVEDIRAPTYATLDLYCDRVASAVGRLSVRVFGMPSGPGQALARHLGRALQLTNILRDLDEDADVGRLYLPCEALQRAGIGSTEPHDVLAAPGLGAVCNEIAVRAREHFAQADAIMLASPRRSVRAPRIMSKVYRLILDGLVARGWDPPRQPVSVPRLQVLWILARYAFV